MEDNNLVDIHLRLPIWTIASSGEYKKDGLLGSVKIMQSTEYGYMLPLYTKEELAKKLIEEGGMADAIAVCISDPKSLKSLLGHYENHMVVHAAIDASFGTNPRNDESAYPTIRYMLEQLSTKGI